MAALRLSFTWFGVRKTLTDQQKAQAAESFGAAGPYLSAGKKLLDTRHPRFKAVTAVRRQATAYFQGMSLPFPEPAVRLVRRDDLDDIQQRMTELAAELASAAAELDATFDELQSVAREKLGRLYSAADYPRSLAGQFRMSWEFPSVEPPEYLRRLSPELYRQECQRAAARFDEAVELAEQMFLQELGELVTHLADRLSGAADGKPKIFRDSAVENLTEFFERFAKLNIRSSAELEALVDQAREVIEGVGPQRLRDSSALRNQVSVELARVQSHLDELIADRPRRNIIRRPR
jgi:hypothetical protein